MWQEVAPTLKPDVTTRYRWTFWLGIKDTQENIDKVKRVLINASNYIDKLSNDDTAIINKIWIEQIATVVGTGTLSKFPVRITFHFRKPPTTNAVEITDAAGVSRLERVADPDFFGADDLLLVAGVLAALILIATISFVVVSKTLEKEILSPTKKILPGIGIVVLVIAALYFKGKG